MQALLQRARRTPLAAESAFLAIVGLIEYIVYFRHSGHFFQGDTLFLFSRRPLTLADFFRNFLAMDPSGRYRPLGNWLVPFLFYPQFGLNPIGYRVIGFAVFFTFTVAVYVLIRQLTGSRVAACISTFFFATHTIHAWSTFDVAFVTELLYALFYVCSVIAFVRYLRTHRRSFLFISLLCFAGVLVSKETGVTLPATLIAVVLFEKGFDWKALTKAGWHVALAAVYLLLTIGYLNVYRGAFVAVLSTPPQTKGGGYYFQMHPMMVLQNVDQAMTWAFNIPRTGYTESRQVPPWTLLFLRAFRFAIAALGLIVLFGYRRRWLLLGLAWFLIAVSPPLFLVGHFIPYYLLLPLAGFSLVIGACGDWLYQYLSRKSAAMATVVCFVPLAVLCIVCAPGIENDARDNGFLGDSARFAQQSLKDIKALYPELKPNTTLYILNDDDATFEWDHGIGGVFKLGYPNSDLRVLYSNEGVLIPSNDPNPLIILKNVERRLQDVTADVDTNPSQYADYVAHYIESPYKMKLDTADVVAGSGSYTMTIEGLANKDVTFQYALNHGQVKIFSAHLDANGQAKFDVGRDTPRGFYQFIAFNISDSTSLIRTDAAINIR